MADPVISIDKVKAFWHSQVHDEEKWALNMKLLRAAGLFAGSIFLMRNYAYGYVRPKFYSTVYFPTWPETFEVTS
ncbi:hypothetical protein QQP08_010607 [Theobroma cacao]|nr:hypothetical protein QQP08_010607 [Theobroma cacao]